MIVRVYDFLSAEKPKFSQNLVGIVSDVESFKYTRRAYDIGSFEMTIPTHADEAGCIQPDRMLIVGEKLGQTYIASDPTKRIVRGTFLYVTDIEKKDDKITVTGYDLKYLFALRVTLFPKEEQDKGTYGYYVTSGTTFSCISNIINYNIVNATDSDRQIYGMFGITMPVNQINADPPLTGIQDDRYMTRLEPVSTAIFNLLKNCKTHFYDMRLIIDDNAEDSDNYNPHMESSEDKPVIIIDESRYNIKSYTRRDGTSAYKNAIYAVVGSGDDVTIKCVKRPNDTASGVKRKEVVLDVDTDSVAEIDRYALKAAEEYVVSDDFEIEPLFMDDEAEPELAQKVSIRIDGVEYKTVITEITDEYANGKHTQSYVCGDKKLKVLNVLNKATAGNTQKIINNKITTGNAGGVGKFTNTAKNCEVFNDYENNIASAYYSHAEGYKTTASAPYSHAEGKETTASNEYTHAEGRESKASGTYSHAEGGYTQAIGTGSHAEGYYTVAGGEFSHASGVGTQAGSGVFAIGRWNKTASDVLFVVGNGWNTAPGDESTAYRSDAMVLDISGNLHIAGKLTADGGVEYVLPTATAYTLGGVKIGDNISVTADGVISVNLSEYLKSAEISDWAKAENKPAYTASEVGLGNVDNTADIDKPISTATQMALDSKDYLKATEITGQTIDLNNIALNTASDKGKSRRYFCTSASAQNISNRPVSANEPFELTVDNIRYVNADAFNSVQRYTSVTRKRSYTRWCDDNIWRAWMCDTDIVIYGTVTSELPKSFDYATYGEGYNQVEIEPYYDNNASPIRNRIVLTLTSATFYDRDVLTVGDSVEHLKIENGTVTMSLTGTKTLSFMIKYTNKRA
jgi:hypothetical protein|nr:MAG TPA: receptor binding complex [Caudoviricetes sp.]